jgi:thymidylate synthase (FAD)
MLDYSKYDHIDVLVPNVTIITPNKSKWVDECKLIEKAARTSYKSEGNITDDSYEPFITKLMGKKHYLPIEFGHLTVRITTNIGIARELLRHRLLSAVERSTRYVNYSLHKFGNKIPIISPFSTNDLGDHIEDAMLMATNDAAKAYLYLTEELRVKPQFARDVLPLITATEITVTANFREWLEIFRLRVANKNAHPNMRRLLCPLYQECIERLPFIFEIEGFDPNDEPIYYETTLDYDECEMTTYEMNIDSKEENDESSEDGIEEENEEIDTYEKDNMIISEVSITANDIFDKVLPNSTKFIYTDSHIR